MSLNIDRITAKTRIAKLMRENGDSLFALYQDPKVIALIDRYGSGIINEVVAPTTENSRIPVIYQSPTVVVLKNDENFGKRTGMHQSYRAEGGAVSGCFHDGELTQT